jgi:DNA-binding MarR family transcriptional regulator
LSSMSTAKSTNAWGMFLMAHNRATEELERRAAATGLPPMDWYDVLWALERAGDTRLRMSDLADMMVTSRSNLTRLLDRLEAAGLAVRERCSEDRRTTYAVITPEGKKLRKKAWVMYEKAIEDVFNSQLTDKELSTIHDGLSKVVQNLRMMSAVQR